MLRSLLFLISIVILASCATPPKYEAKRVDSPMPDELLGKEAFEGQWEIKKCLNAKQAERIEFRDQGDGSLKLKRWQWKKDLLPLFEVSVKSEKQKVVTYQSKDMHDLNPVINHTTWTWIDNRVVGSFQWQPDKDDQRGTWSGVAVGQFFIKKEEPQKLFWNRWGTTHSTLKGLTQWKSSCVYEKVSSPEKISAMKLDALYDSLHLSEKIEPKMEAKSTQIGPEERRQRDLEFLRKSRRESP